MTGIIRDSCNIVYHFFVQFFLLEFFNFSFQPLKENSGSVTVSTWMSNLGVQNRFHFSFFKRRKYQSLIFIFYLFNGHDHILPWKCVSKSDTCFFFFFYVSTFRWLLYNVAKLIALSPLVDMDSRELETSKRTENGILIK